MEKVIVVSGPIGAGKSAFIREFQSLFGGERLSTRKIIIDQTGAANERKALQEAGDLLDKQTDGIWVANAAEAAQPLISESFLLVDAIRIEKQRSHLRARFADKLFHIHLFASDEILEKRYAGRPPQLKEFATYAEVRANTTESNVGGLASGADLVVDAGKTDPRTIAYQAAYSLGFYKADVERLVDVLVGAQFGSEGKGNICAFLAKEYQVLMRVGGPTQGTRWPIRGTTTFNCLQALCPTQGLRSLSVPAPRFGCLGCYERS